MPIARQRAREFAMIATSRNKTLHLSGWIALALLMFTPNASPAIVTGSYMYNLSNFHGTVKYNWSRLYFDLHSGEIYVAEGGTVKVFNSTGMEIYSFGEGELGSISDVAVDSEGNVFTLSWWYGGYHIGKCDFRGELQEKIQIGKLPEDFIGFSPNRMIYREGRFFLVDKNRLRVAVVDKEGVFLKGYDLAALIDVKDKEQGENDIFGFSMDREGNFLFTIPVHFRAYKVTPEGKVSSFGQRGSAPGKFGVVAGIAADGKGNILVSDTLRSVVMIFDKEFRFQSEFGKRGFKPGNLIGPRDLEVDGNNRVFVTQLRNRGVSVYHLSD